MLNPISRQYLIRVSTNPIFGSGHTQRVSALRSFMRGSVQWFVDPEGVEVLRQMIPASDKIIEERRNASVGKLIGAVKSCPSPIVICDSHQIRYEKFKGLNKRIFVFFDGYDWDLPDECVVVNYQPNVLKKSNSIVGLEYMPLEMGLKTLPNNNFIKTSGMINCLVSFGTVDSKNHTCLALSAIVLDDQLKDTIRPVCMIGPLFRHAKPLYKLLEKFPHIKVIRNSKSILNLPVTCSIAVGSPGLSHGERLYAGISTVLVPQNAMHRKLCKNWQKEKCGVYSAASRSEIAGNIKGLMNNNFQKAREISERGQTVVDGKGAKRLLEAILQLCDE